MEENKLFALSLPEIIKEMNTLRKRGVKVKGTPLAKEFGLRMQALRGSREINPDRELKTSRTGNKYYVYPKLSNEQKEDVMPNWGVRKDRKVGGSKFNSLKKRLQEHFLKGSRQRVLRDGTSRHKVTRNLANISNRQLTTWWYNPSGSDIKNIDSGIRSGTKKTKKGNVHRYKLNNYITEDPRFSDYTNLGRKKRPSRSKK